MCSNILDKRQKIFTMRVVRYWNKLPICGDVQGQVERGFGQPGLAEHVPAPTEELELSDF